MNNPFEKLPDPKVKVRISYIEKLKDEINFLTKQNKELIEEIQYQKNKIKQYEQK